MNDFIKIKILHTQFEAQLLDSILNEQNIPHLIQSYHDLAYDGIFQVQKGWGAIYARNQDKEVVIQILDEIRKGAAES